MKNILPIEMDPTIKTYQYLAYPFSILGKNEDSNNWLCNQYTQLIDDGKNDLTFYLDFLNKQDAFECASIRCERLKELKIDIIEFIQNEIRNGWYVYLCVDEFYIPDREAYLNNHFIHDCLIYGVNEINKELYIIGYNEKIKYKASCITYTQFKNSKPEQWIYSIRKNEQYNFILDVNKIYLDLQRYLNLIPEVAVGDFDYKSALFGQETNISLLRNIKKAYVNKRLVDIRHIYLFYEHKKCMLIRLKKLQSIVNFNPLYIEEYEDVMKESHRLVMLVLKYNIKYNNQFYFTAKKHIYNILKKERKIIMSVIEKMH